MPIGVYERKKKDPILRFVTKFERGDPNSCWEWQGAKSCGYGSFRVETRRCVTAHRYAYERLVGEVPTGYVVDHLCRNPACVNPAHLEAVSMAENTLRGVGPGRVSAKGRARTHCKRGHPLFGANLIRDLRGHRGCKACRAEKAKEWAAANRDRINELQRIRRAA